MPIAAPDASTDLFLRGLRNLEILLARAEAHLAGADPAALLGARLADDMHDLAFQVQWTAEAAKIAVARLIGEPPSPPTGQDRTFADLHRRIDEAIARLQAVPAELLEAGLGRDIEIRWRGETTTFTGAAFLLQFAIPNFSFHLSMAYAILRQQGVPVTKAEYTGFSFG